MKVILLILIAYSFLHADLSRSGNSVSDSETNLQWQDDLPIHGELKWIDAISYCEALSLDGESDWRLPNIKELLSIVDESRHNPPIYDTFVYISSDHYWSSTTFAAKHTNISWAVDFGSSNSDYKYKIAYLFVRCVRGGQFDNFENSKVLNPATIMYLLD